MKTWKAFLLSFFIIVFAVLIKERSTALFFLSSQARINPEVLKEEFDPLCKEAVCDNKIVPVPEKQESTVQKEHEPTLTPSSTTNLQKAESESGEVAAVETSELPYKRIEVDLTNQRLYAYEGESQVHNFLVSTGKFNRTPTGRFKIWIKLRYTKMSGGSKALGTYYYLPNVPYVMYFYNDKYPQHQGYGIHGTYWHNNFGHPMSHGCINLKTSDAEKLYYWAKPDLNGKSSIRSTEENPGTEVIIYGKAPS
ncbi:L,D-transpeptidase [Candidatus Microgenomates bacterium]|jgi:lipoprotein-anchoring transpeptidase ErfK/SrfK|nr:MAG: L,D-transpeptidase [Candidatus Microgenomates bacterium]